MRLALENVSVYPLSAGPAVEVTDHLISRTGLLDDRRLVLYDPASRKRMGAKECPTMFAAQVSLDDVGLIRIKVPEGEIRTTRFQRGGEPVVVDEFGDKVSCLDLGDRAAEIMSAANDCDVRLAQKSWTWRSGLENYSVADRRIQPLHMVFQPTVQWVNELTSGNDVDHRRFRPNLVFSGTDQPNEELELVGRSLTIGQVPIRITRAVARCVVTGYDPATGEKLNDVPKVFKQLPYREDSDGKSKPVHGLYGYAEIATLRSISIKDEVRLN